MRKLLIIGGAEAKASDERRVILERVAAAVRTRLVIMTVATKLPRESWHEYERLFTELGVEDVDLLDIRTRDDAYAPANVERLVDGAVCFLTGGDQLRVTSQLGGSPVCERMRELYAGGSLVCGTSAGAAAAAETMLIDGPGNAAGEIEHLAMGPGLGLMPGVVLDSHFAQRGRIGRLVAAIAQNPAVVGIGIDEDTAIAVELDDDRARFSVLGSQSVSVLDGSRITHANVADGVSVAGVVLHVLREGDAYDLATRCPVPRDEDGKASVPDDRCGRPVRLAGDAGIRKRPRRARARPRARQKHGSRRRAR